jgi:phospholipase/carboxylesterase
MALQKPVIPQISRPFGIVGSNPTPGAFLYHESRCVIMKNVIMLHGRGASKQDMLSFSSILPKANYIALQAPHNNSWFPHSFIAAKKENEPYITEAIGMIYEAANRFDNKTVIILGFSQGACLAAEFALRHPKRYGGILIFSGGYIGDTIPETVNLEGTPVFIGCSDEDPYIPLERVNETVNLLLQCNADVDKYIYKGNTHRISYEETARASRIIS